MRSSCSTGARRGPAFRRLPVLHTLTRSANWLAGELRDIGFPTPEIWTGQKGQRRSLNGAPPPDPPPYWSTVTMPSAQEENWDQTSPFDPVPRDGRLYGRGRSDAKGKFRPTTGVSGPISTPPAALRPRVNLKLLIKGEEEAGSPRAEGLD
jgi:acetylornithine deacetylase/succinyl-diaminopimelate desuccinylase-like protein